MKFTYLTPLVLLLVSCNPLQKKEESTTVAAINRDAPYLWHNYTTPLTLQISDDFSNDEVTNIQAMSTAWKTSVEDKKTFFDYGPQVPEKCDTVPTLDGFLDSTLGVYKCETEWDPSLPTSALAVTQIYGYRHNVGTASEYVEIQHADILVNYRYHDFDTADSGFGYDLRTVVLHEMGHFMGLQHKSSSSVRSASVMFPSISSDEAKRGPKAIDIADISSKYNITLDSGGVVAAMITDRPVYRPLPNTSGEPVKVLIELHADGECVHKVDGAVSRRHLVNSK